MKEKKTFFDEMGKLGVGSGSYKEEAWRAIEKLRQVVLNLVLQGGIEPPERATDRFLPAHG